LAVETDSIRQLLGKISKGEKNKKAKRGASGHGGEERTKKKAPRRRSYQRLYYWAGRQRGKGNRRNSKKWEEETSRSKNFGATEDGRVEKILGNIGESGTAVYTQRKSNQTRVGQARDIVGG